MASTPALRVPLLVRGQRKWVEIVGIASSPEFVFAVAPGDILPEPRRFGVLWMNREAIGRALDLDGAFNDVVLRLQADADRRAVIAAIDARLARYGGRGLYGRDRMLSARYLNDELSQLRTLASILPPIFLLVAVFLINVTLSRLVATERANIGLLKAFGYGNGTIGLHYAKFALAFCLGAAAARDRARQITSAGTWPMVYHARLQAAGAAVPCRAAGASRRARGSPRCRQSSAPSSSVRACGVRLAPAVALSPPAPTKLPPLRRADRAGGCARMDARSRMLARRILQVSAPLGNHGRRHRASRSRCSSCRSISRSRSIASSASISASRSACR
jgi:putative ABC transport system permease protein